MPLSHDTNIGAKRARETRAALGVHPAEPLPCLLTLVEEAAEIPVFVTRMPEGMAGCYWRDAGRQMIHVNGGQALVRQRFTLAHELGHARCGHAGSVDLVDTIFGTPVDRRERQANAFAAEFLVPRQGLEDVLAGEPTLDHLVLIAAAYGVSAQAALYRCATCGLVGDARKARLEEEIAAGEHHARHEALAPDVVQDALAAIDELPYLSPSIRRSRLGADSQLAQRTGPA